MSEQYRLSMEAALDQWKRAASQQGEKIITLQSDLQTLRDERDRLAELVRQAQPHVCSLFCPSVKARHELWTHTKLCLNMQAALTPAGGGQDE